MNVGASTSGTTPSPNPIRLAISTGYPNLSTFCWRQILPESAAHSGSGLSLNRLGPSP